MSLFKPLRPYTHPLGASTLIILLGLGAILLHSYTSLQSQNRQLDQLGETLAKSAAQRAVDATLSQDLLSLRASLQDLARHPQVVGATIHDVENRLLVQSGFGINRFHATNYRRYSAAVTLDDKVAGHLQLTLKPARLDYWDWRFFGLWGLAVILAAFAPWWRYRPGATAQPGHSDPVEYDTIAEPTEGQGGADSQAPAKLRLRLQLVNLKPLFEQLNRDGFNHQLTRLEQQLKGVIALYGGQYQALSEDTLLIDFSGGHSSDCAFRALCSAQLLGELSHLNPGPRLRLAAQVHALPTPDTGQLKLADAFALQYQPAYSSQAPGIVITPELIDAELQQHLELDSETGLLIGVKAPYRRLLDRQQQQLEGLAQRSPSF